MGRTRTRGIRPRPPRRAGARAWPAWAALLLPLAACLAAAPSAAQQSGRIAGVVLESGTRRPLANVEVGLLGTAHRTLSGADGRFALGPLAPGDYTLEAASLGHRPHSAPARVAADSTTALELLLDPAPISLGDLVVSPGHFGIAHERLGRRETLRRAQIERLPQLGDDIFRTVNRLPGMGSHEFKARFTVRGGDDESVLVRLDGLELFEPYHLKDFDGSLSILDVAAIGGVDLTTGGFPASHGNHLTGVFDLTTTSRILPRPRTELALTLGNVRAMSQGAFADGKGLWLFSARRGYLDLLLRLAGQDADVDPRYHDALGKVVYQLGDHTLAAHVLHAGDRATLRDDDETDPGVLTSGYRSSYGWLRWQWSLGRGLAVETLGSASRLTWSRDAHETGLFEIDDRRALRVVGVRQEWQAEPGERVALLGGWEARAGSADYDYASVNRVRALVDGAFATRFDSTRVRVDAQGSELGAWASGRIRPWQPLTLEAGLRWDRQGVTGESQWSPRLAAMLSLGERTTLRGGWGLYAQPQRLHQLSVRDGEREFQPAQRAEQWVAGVEHRLAGGTGLRAELYRRAESRLRPRFLNLGGFIEPVGEVEGDRFRIRRERGLARGLELMAQRERERSSWRVSWALSSAEDLVEGRWTPRPLEQRHTLYLDHAFAPRPGWQLSWAWQLHSGWPTTPVTFGLERLANGNTVLVRGWGEYNSERLPRYHRMDARLSRDLALGRGRLHLFLDVFNVYNRKNPQAYLYRASVQAGRVEVARTVEPLLPIMPSLGVLWAF